MRASRTAALTPYERHGTFGHRRPGEDIGLIMHLSASTSLSPGPNGKVLITPVEGAIRMVRAIALVVHQGYGVAEAVKETGL